MISISGKPQVEARKFWFDLLVDKWRAFGWDTHEIDGHDIEAIFSALAKFPSASNKPTLLLIPLKARVSFLWKMIIIGITVYLRKMKC